MTSSLVNDCIFLSDSELALLQVLHLPVRVELGVMAKRAYSILLKAPELEIYHQMVYCHIHDTCLGESYTFEQT